MKNIKMIVLFLSCLLAIACAKKNDTPKPAVTGPVLSISSIDPLSGAMNDSLRIFGAGFSTDTSKDLVTINGVKAIITRVSATELKVMVPARAYSGYVNVQVGGTTVKGPAFTYTITTGIVSTLAGSGTAGYQDGAGINAQFNSPQVLALDSSGNLFVGDVKNYRIRKVSVNDGTVTSFAGSGNLEYGDIAGRLNQFAYISGLAVDKNGTVYAADNKYDNIRSISSDGTHITTVAGGNTADAYFDDVGTRAAFAGPNGIVFDNAGNLLIADQRNGVIRKLTLSTGAVSTLIGRGPTYLGVVVGMAYNHADSSFFVADIYHNWIDRFLNGFLYTSFGTGTAGYADGKGGFGTEFNEPTGVALDNSNEFTYNIFVTDLGNNCIRMIDGYYNALTIAGSPAGGFADGVGKAAKFNSPYAIVADNKNHTLYVADSGNNRIRKILLE